MSFTGLSVCRSQSIPSSELCMDVCQAEDSHEKSENVIIYYVYNHTRANSTIYDCTFVVQNNILCSYLLACICVVCCFGVHFNDVNAR